MPRRGGNLGSDHAGPTAAGVLDERAGTGRRATLRQLRRIRSRTPLASAKEPGEPSRSVAPGDREPSLPRIHEKRGLRSIHDPHSMGFAADCYFSNAFEITTRWISLVPSYICATRLSRQWRSTSPSFM